MSKYTDQLDVLIATSGEAERRAHVRAMLARVQPKNHIERDEAEAAAVSDHMHGDSFDTHNDVETMTSDEARARILSFLNGGE